jgi:hypothetical protein
MLDRTEFEPFGMPKQSIHDFSIGWAARQGHTRNRAAVIELTLQHPNFSGFQIDEIISEWFAIRVAHATINRLNHLAYFKFLPGSTVEN